MAKSISKKSPDKRNNRSLGKTDNSLQRLGGLVIISLLTIVVFSGSITKIFIALDDQVYINDNPYIKSLSWNNIKDIFSVFYNGNYHPFTTLLFAIEYKWFGLNAESYHIISLILHLVNTWLVFIFLQKISGRIEAGFIGSILFAIHPMHVESVVWISEQKDVLYGLFFIAGLITYLRYIDKGKPVYYLLTLLLFLFSLLSKSAAVTFPLVLVLCDYFLNRGYKLKILMEKVPFFLLSAVFGMVTILSQDAAGAIMDETMVPYTLFERFFVVSYAIVYYIIKFVAPYDLCVLHYAPKDLSFFFYLCPFIILLIGFFTWRSKLLKRELIFGFLFYLFSILLVIQIIPVGFVIVSERYSYISYIGLVFITGIIYVRVKDSNQIAFKTFKPYLAFIAGLMVLIFSFISFQYIKKWRSSEVLFEDIVNKNPDSGYGYNSFGKILSTNGKPDRALEQFNKAIEKDSSIAEAYFCRANILFDKKNYESAIRDYLMSQKLQPDYPESYNNLAFLLSENQRMEEAIFYYSKALKYKPTQYLFQRRATCYTILKKYAEALQDYSATIRINPQLSEAFFNRGVCYFYLQKNDSACVDWKKASAMGYEKANSLLGSYCK